MNVSKAKSSPPLAETEFVVVDIETTGGTAGKDAILEIGAVRIRHGKIVDRWSQLIQPHQPIPPYIQKLTGITPAMVEAMPTIDAVLPTFLDFLGDAVFVAHHTPFDFRFLSAVTETLTGTPLNNQTVCTCKLARKLLPDLRQKNLGAVAAHFNISITARHRALGDADATALVLLRYFDLLVERDITTLAELVAFQEKSPKAKRKEPALPFPTHRLSEYPQTPGVYLMKSQSGDILYIGKAKNLRRRLQSYFSHFRRLPSKVQELLPQVYDIEIRLLGSDLEALLEEARLIKTHVPYYNRQIKAYKQFPFLKIRTDTAYPQLESTLTLESDGALYFGPFTRQTHLSHIVDTLSHAFSLRSCSPSDFKKHQREKSPCLLYDVGSCSGPCARLISASDYQTQIDHLVALLSGEHDHALKTLTEKREAYAEAMHYEKAQQVQDQLRLILKLQLTTNRLQNAIHHHHYLAFLPQPEPQQTLCLWVYKGQPFDRMIWDPQTDSPEAVVDRTTRLLDLIAKQPPRTLEAISQDVLEEMRILANWRQGLSQAESDACLIDLTQPVESIFTGIQKRLLHRCVVAAG